MKKYSVIVTIIALGLLVYILAGGVPRGSQQTAASASKASVVSSYTAAPRKQTSVSRSMPTSVPSSNTYILNKNTKVFHKPTCSSVNQMKDSNKKYYTGSRVAVIDMGYKPCGRCHP